jgi:hypothetical protein
MSVFIETSQSNLSGFVTIPDDDRDDILDAEEKRRTLPSAYEKTTFSVDMNFTAYYLQIPDLEKVYVDVLAVTPLYDFNSIGLTANPIDTNTLRVSGTTSNVFPGTYFQFTMPTLDASGTKYEQEILDANTTKDFYALNYYEMPQPTELELTYPIKLRVQSTPLTPEQDIEIDLFQWHYWEYEPARRTIIDLVARGKN